MTHDLTPPQHGHLARLVKRLPSGCAIVCPPERKQLYKDQARKLNRQDLTILAPGEVRGLEFTSVLVEEVCA